MTDETPPDEIRTAREVARRSLALSAAVVVALGAPIDQVRRWVELEGLDTSMTPRESAFVASDYPPRKESIDFSWQSERLHVLLWALGKVDALPPPSDQCDTAPFLTVLPPNAGLTVTEYVAGACLRSADELMAACEQLLDDHWKARDAKLHNRPVPEGINIEIVEERHHAINWVTGYLGLDWDEVTTDT